MNTQDTNTTHRFIVSEQADIIDKNGQWSGVREISVPLNIEGGKRPNRASFLEWLQTVFPLCDWQADDGTDWDEDAATDYCQYVANIDDADASHIYLAVYNAIKTN